MGNQKTKQGRSRVRIRIREVRRAKGITQLLLGLRIGKERSIISRYEDGSVDIPFSVMCDMAKALGVRVTDLIDESCNRRSA